MDWFVRAFLKASLVWLSLGVTLGVAMAAHPVWTIYRPAHMHVLMLGFGNADKQRISSTVALDSAASDYWWSLPEGSEQPAHTLAAYTTPQSLSSIAAELRALVEACAAGAWV